MKSGAAPRGSSAAHRSAAVVAIGNEILSGRTREANAYLAAERLFACGCRLIEITIIPDDTKAVVASLNRLRVACDAVITSGGIGPTHDDITMAAVAEVFGVPLVEDAQSLAAMVARYGAENLNAGRRRMAHLPRGAEAIVCRESIAPGAHIGNVYVLAGVPEIFAAQLEVILSDFGGEGFQRREIEVALPESMFATALGHIQERFPDVEIGSYPARCGSRPCGKICLSARDAARLDTVLAEVRAMLADLEVPEK